MKKLIALLTLAIICTGGAFAQEDLLSLVDSASPPPKENKVYATFKTTKIISSQSIETVKRKNLDFRVTHRFSNIGTEGNGGAHTLWGFDESQDIRISFDYGITNNLMVGIGRSKMNEMIDGLVKYRFLNQTTDNKIPLSIAFYGDMAVSAMTADQIYFGTVGVKDSGEKFAHRITYVSQLIFARKFGSRLSLQLMPTYVHRNFVKALVNPDNGAEETNGLFSAGIGGRVKLTKRISIIADYFYTFSDFRRNNSQLEFYDPLAVGVEIETGGHVFHLNFTNSAGIIDANYIPNTRDNWLDGAFKFGFNISRVFVIK
jgi:hypothetical protein